MYQEISYIYKVPNGNDYYSYMVISSIILTVRLLSVYRGFWDRCNKHQDAGMNKLYISYKMTTLYPLYLKLMIKVKMTIKSVDN